MSGRVQVASLIPGIMIYRCSRVRDMVPDIWGYTVLWVIWWVSEGEELAGCTRYGWGGGSVETRSAGIDNTRSVFIQPTLQLINLVKKEDSQGWSNSSLLLRVKWMQVCQVVASGGTSTPVDWSRDNWDMTIKQCSGSKYIEFGSGSRILVCYQLWKK